MQRCERGVPAPRPSAPIGPPEPPALVSTVLPAAEDLLVTRAGLAHRQSHSRLQSRSLLQHLAWRSLRQPGVPHSPAGVQGMLAR